MELFTLGIGNYSEKDVKEAARTLTGWTVKRGAFADVAEDRDPGTKSILGRNGRWGGDDLVGFLLEAPATSQRLAWRLCKLFLGDGAARPAAVGALAAGLRQHQLDVGWAAGVVLRSRAFFADTNLGSTMLGPAEYVVGAARALELFDPPPSCSVLAEWIAQCGQDLFYPPNVGGWPGGRAWASPQFLIARANYAAALVTGRLAAAGPPDLPALARRHGRGPDLEDVLSFVAELLTGLRLVGAWRKRALSALGPRPKPGPLSLRRGVALLLASPEAQVS
jgi:uncharacterized protein (DUF1800 family)